MKKRKIFFAIFLIYLYMSFSLTVALASSRNEIRLNLPNLALSYYENGKLMRVYPVAAGKNSSRTPIGNYRVINKAKNPTWAPSGSGLSIPPGPRNPLGSRWIGFKPSYGIHGNNRPNSIGRFVSLGCVRLYNFHVEELYDKINIGCPVKITYETIQSGKGSKPYIVVYPDVYNLNRNTKGQIQKKLKENGINISQEKFSRLIGKINSKPLIFAQGYVVTLNGEVITADVLKNEKGFYINKDDIERSLNVHIIPRNPLLNGKYIHIDEVFSINGLNKKVNYQEERVDITGHITTINGKIIPGTRQGNQGSVYIPIRTIAENLGLSLSWNQKVHKPYLNNIPINATVISGRSFLNYTDLERNLNCDLFFDGKKKLINISKLAVFVNGKRIDDVKIIAGKAFLPVRKVANILGYNVNWEKDKVTLNNVLIQGMTVKGTFYSNVESLAEALSLKLDRKSGQVSLILQKTPNLPPIQDKSHLKQETVEDFNRQDEHTKLEEPEEKIEQEYKIDNEEQDTKQDQELQYKKSQIDIIEEE